MVTYMDTDLPPRATRHYRVRAINEVDTGPASETAMAMTGMDLPGAPTGLTATAGLPATPDGTTLIDLAWTEPAEIGLGITGYKIEVSEDGGNSFETLVANHDAMENGAIVTAYPHTGLGSETARHYRVFAINTAGTGPVSNADSATTADIARPVAVSASVDTAGTTLRIVFDEALDETAANAPAAERFAVTAADGAEIAIGGVAVSGTNVTLSGLSPAIKRGQTVTAGYADPSAGDDAAAVQDDDPGNDAASFAGLAVANGSTAAPALPGKPRNAGAEARGPDRIRLSWEAPADTGGRAIARYRIEVSTDGLNFGLLVEGHDTMLDGAIVTAYEHTGLNPRTTLHYRLYAINAVGAGPVSDTASATTSTCAPGAPMELTATAGFPDPRDGTTQIVLSWTAPTDLGTPASTITGYRIEYSPDGSDGTWQDLVANTGNTDTTYSNTGLGSEIARHYRVSAMVAGCSAAGLVSDTAHATTADIDGPVPQSATVTGAGTGVAIVFDEALDGTEANAPAKERFTVTADGAPVTVGSVTVWGTLKRVVLGGLSPAIKSGQPVVVAYTDPSEGDDAAAVQDGDGNDAASFTLGPEGSVTVTNGSTVAPTVPGAPTALAATADGETAVDLSWEAPADNGGRPIARYLIEVSEDGATFTTLEADHNTMQDDEIVRRYRHEVTLSRGDVRHYRVSATNAVGTGLPSDAASATTVPEGAPDAPTGLAATANEAAPGAASTQIDLAWTGPVDEGASAIAGYLIEVSEDGGSTFTTLVPNHDKMENGAIETAYAHTGLGSEITRHYRVRASNGQGTGLPSNVAHATTADIVAPEPQSASVPAAGASLTIVFDEALDGASGRTPKPGDFKVFAGSMPIAIAGIAVDGAGQRVSLNGLVPTLKRDQTVTVGYTDPTAGDDTAAAQDEAGNDAASFEEFAVVNGSDQAPTAPARPTGLRATAGGDTRIDLSWDAPADNGGRAITGYRIERSADGMTGWQELVEDTGTTVRTHPDTENLDRDTTRHYRVSAINAIGTGPVSDSAMATTTTDGPGPPTGLTATAAGDTIRLTWTEPGDVGASAIAGYRVERSADGMTGWQDLVANTGSAATAYDDTGLPHGTTRHYRVSAINGHTTGGPSNVAHATVDIVAPMPQSARVAAAGVSLRIVFDEALDATTAGAPSKERFAVTAADGAEIVIGSVAVSGTDVTLTLASGSPAIKSGQAVTVAYTDPTAGDDSKAVQDTAGNDAASFTVGPGERVTVTNGSTEAATVPGAPTGLGASLGGSDRFEIVWTKPEDTGGRAITGYLIEVSTDGTTFTELVANHNTMQDGEIETSYVHIVPGLSVGAMRHYRVKAINAVGTGPASNVAGATAVDPDAPDAVTDLTATAGLPATPDGTTLIDLAWTKPTDTGASAIAGYRIEWSANGTSDWKELVANHDTMAGGEILTGYSDDGLGSETTRYYRVFAINGQGSSLPSNVAHTSTADIVAPRPQSARVAAAGASLTIVFDEALDATTAGAPAKSAFAVTAADGAEIAIGAVAVSGTDVTLTGLSPAIKSGQTVTVAYTDPTAGDDSKAVQDDDPGNDAATFEDFAVTNGSTVGATVPGAPTGLAAEGAGSDRIGIEWTKPEDTGGRAITGYLIEVSEDGDTGPFTVLVANHNAIENGEIVTAYTQTTGLSVGDVRHYRVKAINAIGTGPASNVDGAMALPDGVSDPVTDLTATATDVDPTDTATEIELAWTKPANEGASAITGYRIEWSADGSAPWTELVANHDTMAGGEILTGYSDAGLGSETTRYYRVFATNGQGTGLPSSVAHAATADIVAPRPQSASVPAAGVSLTIVFDEALDATTAGAPAKSAFAVTAADGAEIAIGAVAVSGTDVTLTGLSPAIKSGQTVTVGYTDPTAGDDSKAVQDDDPGNDAATFEDFAVTNGSTVAATVPGAPTLEAAGVGDGTAISLTWTKPADTGGQAITGYAIEVSTAGATGPFTVLVANHNEMADGEIVTVYPDTDVMPDDMRHYRVKAINAVGTGPASNVAGATAVDPDAPDAPTGLTATARDAAPGDTSTAIDLAWTKPANEGASAIAGYLIEVSEDGGSTFTTLVPNHDEMENGAIETAYAHTGLGSEITRHYRVRATNGQGTGLPSSVAHATTVDIVAPEPQSASVAAAGASLRIVFDEALDATTAGAPAKERFAIAAADGAEIAIGAVAVSGTDVTLTGLTPAIKSGQTVTVGYTDPTAGDDSKAVQDDPGNDAATFEDFAVTNGSTVAPTVPGMLTGLTATGTDYDEISLTWEPPADTGGQAITGYAIEVSTAGATGPFAVLVANHNAIENGEIVTAYEHTGLSAGATRHYRVKAKNSVGTGPASNVAEGQALAPAGRVEIAADPASPAEGADVTVTVTATTSADVAPEGDFNLVVRLATEDGTAVAPGDFAALDTTRTFTRGSFSRQDADGEQRWVARKTVTVAIADDVEVEAEEAFALTAAIESQTSDYLVETARAEVAIPNTDEWGVEVVADPGAIAEGENREVTLTARIVPVSADCVVRFPVTVALAVGGTAENEATPGTDYAPVAAPAEQEIAACAAGVTWQVRLNTTVDTENDPDETVTFTPSIAGMPEIPVTAAAVILRQEPGVALSRHRLSFLEGASASYTVALTAAPSGNVTVTPRVRDNGDVTVSPTRLVFTTQSWHEAQAVTVSAADDTDEDHDTATVEHSVSASGGYGGVSAGAVAVAVRDTTGADDRGAVRLGDMTAVPGGGQVGRVEVAYNGEWGTVCNDRQYLGNLAPVLACRLLDHETGRQVRNRNSAEFNADASVPIWLDDVRCLAGTHDGAVTLDQCYNVGVGNHNCTHSEDLWVRCEGILDEGESPALGSVPRLLMGDAGGMEGPYDGPDTLVFSVVLTPPARHQVTVEYATRDVAGDGGAGAQFHGCGARPCGGRGRLHRDLRHAELRGRRDGEDDRGDDPGRGA